MDKSVKGIEESDVLKTSDTMVIANQRLPFWIGWCCSFLGIFAGMGLICFISFNYNMSYLIPSFASSAIMVFTSPNNRLAQPRNVLGGHVMSGLAGIITSYCFGNSWWAVTLAVVLATLFMLGTRTLHPPGGGTAIVAQLGIQGHNCVFLFLPIVADAVIIVLVVLIIRHVFFSRKHAASWV